MKPWIVSYSRFVLLTLSLLLLGPQLALAQLKVEAGSTGNKVILTIHNGNESVMEGIGVEVLEPPEFVENVTIKPNRIPTLAAGKSQDIEIEFGIRADAPPCGSGELEFLITSKVGMFDDPTPGLILQVVALLNSGNTLVEVLPVSSEAPDDFPLENAIDYCDRGREPNEYDRVAVFFTLPYDVSEPFDEKCPFMWRILGPNGDKPNGGSGVFAPKHSEPSFAKNGSPGRFVSVLDLWRRGDNRDPSKARSGPGTYTLQVVAADYGATGTFGQGETMVIIATTGRDENGESIVAEWQNVKTFEIKSSRLHFQGFVIEQVKDAWLPDRNDIWEGKLTVNDPKINGSAVTIGAEAWIRKARRDGTGRRPEEEVHRTSTFVTIDFPEELAPGHEEMGEIHTRIEPGEQGEYLMTAGMHLLIPTKQLPPDRHLVERGALPAPWANEGALPEDYCNTFWTGDERFEFDEYSGDGGTWVWQRTPLPRGCDKKEAAKLDVRTTLLSGDKNLLAGDPGRYLLEHLHNSDTRYVIPVFINLTDEARVRDYSRSLEMKTYGYAIYAAEPGTYEGPPPNGRPPVGDGPDSEPESEDGDRDDSDGTGQPVAPEDELVPSESDGTGTEGTITGETDSGDEDATGTGVGPDTDEGREIDPNTLDPNSTNVKTLIRKWIAMAEPPKNAIEGNNFHYSNKGRIVGTAAGGVIESRHETGAFDPVFLWKNQRQLDSINHCTMEEYVVAKLEQNSITHCAGRYGAVKDLKGLELKEAMAAVTAAGFKYDNPVSGTPAATAETDGTIERQEPGPDQYLTKGQVLKLVVHTPYVPGIVTLPDFIGKPLGEAKKWLEKNKLKMQQPKANSHTPTREKSGTIEAQEPVAGTVMKAGGKVTFTVYSNYVDTRRVPNVVKFSAGEAKRLIENAGLKADPTFGGKPLSPEQAGTVVRQDPVAGTFVSPGTEVEIFVYTPFVAKVTVPNVIKLSYKEARRRLEAAGLSLSRQQDAGNPDNRSLANTAKKQDPPFGSEVSKGKPVLVWFYGQYVPTREELVSNTDCSRYPGSRAYWDNTEEKPLCGCPEGYTWAEGNTHCKKLLPPNEACARDYPGSIANGRDANGNINCDCPQGYTWAVGNTHCVKLISPNEACARDYPGSIANGRDANGNIDCDCPQGLRWNLNNSACISEYDFAREWCARNQPGSYVQKRPDGGYKCQCPSGYVLGNNNNCVKKSTSGGGGGNRDRRDIDRNDQCNLLISQIKGFMGIYWSDPENNGHLKSFAENNAQQARMLGCDQSQITQALGTGRGGNQRQVENCPPGYYLTNEGDCAKEGGGVFGQ